MKYQLCVDDAPPRLFRHRWEAIFAGKVAIARQGAKDVIVFVLDKYGGELGHFVVTEEDL